MFRFLAVLAWPAGIALILGLTALLARRQPQAVTVPAHRAVVTAPEDRAAAIRSAARLVIFIGVGGAAVYCLMLPLGLLVVHNGLVIDHPVFNWTLAHQSHVWVRLMKRLTKIGDTWTTWGAAGAAAVCLAVTWRKQRWLPPVALATLIVVDHFTTLAIRDTFHRPGPPTSPLGTFPSGGCERVIVFYGLIGYLLWREFSGSRRTAVWIGGTVAALAFSEAYSRGYLLLHWFTDILSGLLYGCLLLGVCIAAVRFVAGPAAAGRVPPGQRSDLAPALREPGDIPA